jgi:S-adenosylmethionine/arginine decarboxylase-like enzyme
MSDDVYVWGYHVSLDMGGCNKKKITDREHLISWVKALVDAIDMKAYGEPEAVHFAEHDPGKAGYTVTQLIETSNICGHFVDATGEAYIDVFSCKPFDPDVVAEVCGEWFEPQTGDLMFRERGAKPAPTLQ